jgi:hypothetical protein
VVIPILSQHYVLLQRNLIYTAVTRGRKLVILVGTRKALAMGIKNDKTKRRYTASAEEVEFLTEIMPQSWPQRSKNGFGDLLGRVKSPQRSSSQSQFLSQVAKLGGTSIFSRFRADQPLGDQMLTGW